MRLVFMGSPEFAVPALRALCATRHEVVTVYCQSPKPAGRGQRLTKCAVHDAAEALGIPVRTPRRLRGNAQELDYLRVLKPDVGVVVAYGLILPPEVLDVPRLGCLNIHASLLPRWRGAAPIQAAILAGDAGTGVTIMRMDAGLDTGPTLLSDTVTIGAADTAAVLHDRLSAMGARLILRALAGEGQLLVQADGGTYAPKLSRADALIDWAMPASVIERRVRAFTPWPGTETQLNGQAFKVIEAAVVDGEGEPGVVLDDQLTVACGQAALRLTRVKRAGGAAMDSAAFLRGHPVPPGTRLG
ncbi:MAG: methionyl-tRNA formyltransferase [Acidiphilium sp.]|nr:methionyl-tRNA formyltransferase [Acidiphilium sp.]MDD4934928.1 methionyl-tRNA formyltransferase [Acidiphilium sp.]